MKRKLMFLALAGLGLASCNGGFKKGEGGMLYNIVVDKGGPSIKPGDFIALNYTIKNDADSVLQTSYDLGRPVPQMVQKPVLKGDIFTALSMLSEGDSAVIKLNVDSLSKGKPRDKSFKGKYVVYVLKIEKVIPKGNLSDQVFAGRWQDYLKTLTEAAKKEEPTKITKYIADNKLNVKKTDSGLYYEITKEGTGIKPVPGDTVSVNYTGRFINGKAFETNVKADAKKYKLPINPMNPYKPIRFPIGVKGMIKGWDQGMQLLNKGSKATFIIPSSLAYGEQGNGMIQPFTTLIFDVELLDVVHPNPNAPKPAAPKSLVPTQQPAKR